MGAVQVADKHDLLCLVGPVKLAGDPVYRQSSDSPDVLMNSGKKEGFLGREGKELDSTKNRSNILLNYVDNLFKI